jgi:hypothetical protein
MRIPFSFAIFTLFVSGQATAGSFPTNWHIKNDSRDQIALSCHGEGLGGSRSVEFPVIVIAAGGSEDHAWGSQWYNDGLGLQAANWTCKAGTSPDKMTAAGTFSSDWGQDLTMRLAKAGNGYIVELTGPAKNVAKAKSSTEKVQK